MSITVLIADDHAVVRDLRLLLETQPGIDIVGEAGDGRAAVRQVAELKPDVVLMDIAMPGLNGIEATRKINEENPSAKVLVLSMHAHSEYVFRALQAGAAGYLVKESVGAEVVQAVRTVHNGRRYLSECITDVVVDDYVRRSGQPQDEDRLQRLSSREREVLQLIVEGKTTAEIADIAALSPKTVETYRSRLMKKLEINSLPDLVKFAIQHGLTSLE